MQKKVLWKRSSFLLPCLVTSALGQESHANGYHWARTTNSFDIQVIHSVVPSENNNWNDEFDIAIADWSQSTKLNIVGVCGDVDETTRAECPPVQGKVRVCNYNYGDTGWYGIAQWSYSRKSKHVVRAVVKLNDRRRYSSVGRKHLMCHEIGHTLGLGHTSVDGSSQKSCMDYALNAYESRNPNSFDFVVLDDVYDHLDADNTYVSTLPQCYQKSPSPSPTMSPTLRPSGVPTKAPTRNPIIRPSRAPVFDNTINAGPNMGKPGEEPSTVASNPSNTPPVSFDKFTACLGVAHSAACESIEQCRWDRRRNDCRLSRQYLHTFADSGICESKTNLNDCMMQNGCRWKRQGICIARHRRRLNAVLADNGNSVHGHSRNLRGGVLVVNTMNGNQTVSAPSKANIMGDSVEGNEPMGRQHERKTALEFGLPAEARLVSRSAIVATFEIENDDDDTTTMFDVWLADDEPETDTSVADLITPRFAE